MNKLLNNINGWVHSGPSGNYLMENGDDTESGGWSDYDLDAMVSAGSPEELIGLTGLLPDDLAASDFAEQFGGYLTPYDWHTEDLLQTSFMDTISSSFREAVGASKQISTMSRKSGFSDSFNVKNVSTEVLANAGNKMTQARNAKNEAIYKERTAWVEGLWDRLEWLAEYDAFDPEHTAYDD